jgi:hypothetical protein
METQFQKNRSIHNSMCRYKKDSEGKTVMNGCLIYAEGRFRTPGTKYISYSIKSTPRGSVQGSRRSLNSAGSRKSNASHQDPMDKPSKKRIRERSQSSTPSKCNSVSRYNSANKAAIGPQGVERLRVMPKTAAFQNYKAKPTLGNKTIMPNLLKSTLDDSKNARSFRDSNVGSIRMKQEIPLDLK